MTKKKDENFVSSAGEDEGPTLLALAREKLKNAYAPHSQFRVACVIKEAGGSLHFGVNVENDSLGLTICAERAALCAMVAELGPQANIVALAVLAERSNPAYPCGACRQMLLPFSAPGAVLYVETETRDVRKVTFRELLPLPYKL